VARYGNKCRTSRVGNGVKSKKKVVLISSWISYT
jgi:hypothetical protein